MRGGREDRGSKAASEKICVQCGVKFTEGKINHSCVRCAGCRNFKNGAVPVVCGRCGIKLQINAAIYYSRITKKIEADGAYICSPCKHAIRSRKCKALAKGREVVPEVMETMEVSCGTIYRTIASQRCERHWARDGICEYYDDCLSLAIRRNWPGWRAAGDCLESCSKRVQFKMTGLQELADLILPDRVQQKSGKYA